MKLFNLITMAALISFAVACGKDNSSGGSSGYRSSLSTSGSISQSSREAVDNFNRWYASNYEPSSTSAGVYRVAYASSNVSSGSNNCEQKQTSFLGIPVYYYVCSPSSSSGSSSGLDECRATVMFSTQSLKGNNPSLAKIASGQAGTLVNATYQGSDYNHAKYTLQFQKSNGHVATYIIDTTYHSAFQPVQVTDTETNGLMYLYGTAMAGYNGVSVSGLPICD